MPNGIKTQIKPYESLIYQAEWHEFLIVFVAFFFNNFCILFLLLTYYEAELGDNGDFICSQSDDIRFLIYETNSGPISNDVARLVIEATRSLFLLAVETTTLQRC